MKSVVDGSIVVTLNETKEAMRLMAEKTRIISEARERWRWRPGYRVRPVKVHSSP
jgi:hypothetical protein